MADKLNWSVSVDIPGGPKLKRSQIVDVEAYQQIQVTAPGVDPGKTGPVDTKISVMPNGSAVQFLFISSNVFDPVNLTYKPPKGTTHFVLDTPHVLAGGAIAMLGLEDDLVVTNGTGKDAVITIFVGRDATP